MTSYKHVIFTLILIVTGVLFFSCVNEQKISVDCSSVRTGYFRYNGKFSGHDFIIARHDSVQTEFDLVTRKYIRKRVTWIDSCEYHLRLLKDIPTDSPLTGNTTTPDSPSDELQRIKIISVTKTYYVFKGERGFGIHYTDTMWMTGKRQ